MKHCVCIVSVKPCGCDAEGEVEVTLQDGTSLWFYYQGSDAQAYEHFVPGKRLDVDLVGRLCRAEFTEGRIAKLSFHRSNCTFEAIGSVVGVEADGECLPVLSATTTFHIDIELSELKPQVGDRLFVRGEMWANNWW